MEASHDVLQLSIELGRVRAALIQHRAARRIATHRLGYLDGRRYVAAPATAWRQRVAFWRTCRADPCARYDRASINETGHCRCAA